ncbi:group 10 secretory phospholipase A2 isoform X1 [Oryctolagus cuniculus]|uniref:group 10 secretory phospholipase A2 isoform X1 n=1 Tax=Oryctolagus cuniculus TaxID=9986 RepID=UPI003879CD37
MDGYSLRSTPSGRKLCVGSEEEEIQPSPATPASRRSHVHRRGILDLAGTVSCVGTRSPMAYVDYGCFCGLGGHGQPRDAVDWCCHRHDCCYARAEEAGCSPKMEHYPWECVGQQVLCGPTEDKCQELMCKCDQEIAHCFAQNEYNLKYLFYPQFLCEQDSPKCD